MNPYESGAVIDMNMGHNSAPPAPKAADDAIAAGDGALHGAIDNWMLRALDAERVLLSRGLVLEEAAKACEKREQRSNREDVRATCRLCAKDIRALAVVNQSLTTASTAHPEAPAAQGDALPREDFAWLVVQEACDTEPADEDDPECIRILRRDLKSAVLAAFLRREAARPRRITPHNTTANPNKVA